MMIDSHCHLDDIRFQQQQFELVGAAAQVGVEQIVVPTVWPTNWPAVADLVDRFTGVHAAYGLHPWFLATELVDSNHSSANDLIAQLDDWLLNHHAVAVGECGLDFSRRFDVSQRSHQQELFIGQIELAQRHGLPLILHAHKALDPVIHCLRQSPGIRGVVHRFDGSLQQAQRLIDIGFFIGVAAGITYPKNRKLREVIAQLPLESILLETDAPDLPPAEQVGGLNQPEFMPLIATALANCQGCSRAQVAAQTTANSRLLFGL